MPAARRNAAVPTRRRRDDDGEEEQSVIGEFEDDSLSEGSAISGSPDDADVEGSEASVEEEAVRAGVTAVKQMSTEAIQSATQELLSSERAFKTSADTEAISTGSKVFTTPNIKQEVSSDEKTSSGIPPAQHDADLELPTSKQQENGLERSRREHQEYIRERDTNPAFVPTRGGFFLHDDRTAPPNANTSKAGGRGRGRGAPPGIAYPTRLHPESEPTNKQWAHDLHESVVKSSMPLQQKLNHVASSRVVADQKAIPSPPNRSFSTSTVVGNVPVRIAMPGMIKPRSRMVAKKQHTLLPQHRPPLRRDKPVRISIPDQSPRYIFPSTERSFIFIPRALRPNQQSYVRGRGRGSFHGSRRTSMFGGSAYTPSVVMSRKSSIGGMASGDGLNSPTGSMAPRPQDAEADSTRPIVRMPAVQYTNGPVAALPKLYANGQHTKNVSQGFFHETHIAAIPMHQPRPQKTLSIVDFETPASFSFKPPQQQHEQPFHQQIPAQAPSAPFAEESTAYMSHLRQQSRPTVPAGTPLSQIPEGAIYAQPFLPYPILAPQGYFPAPYPPGTILYPPMDGNGPPFSGSMASAIMAPSFIPSTQPPGMMAAPSQSPAEGLTKPGQASTVAHESNGMVYYYNPSQAPPGSQGTAPSFAIPPPVIGMGGMMTPPAHYYYSHAPNGVFFTPQ